MVESKNYIFDGVFNTHIYIYSHIYYTHDNYTWKARGKRDPYGYKFFTFYLKWQNINSEWTES